MFHDIPEPIKARMDELKERGVRDRTDGTPRMQRLREVPAEVGQVPRDPRRRRAPRPVDRDRHQRRLLDAVAGARRARERPSRHHLRDPRRKVELARETFAVAGVEDVVELVHGDVRDGLADVDGISFAFLDSEKEDYAELYELVVPKLVPGGLLVADNVVDFRETCSRCSTARSRTSASMPSSCRSSPAS